MDVQEQRIIDDLTNQVEALGLARDARIAEIRTQYDSEITELRKDLARRCAALGDVMA